jgi:glycine oxidase
MTAKSAAIVGGGLIGLMAAYRLAKNGWRVTVVDAAPEAREASWAAGGMLAPHHEADAPTPLWRLGVRSLERWHDLLREEPADFDAQPGHGLVPAADDPTQLATLARRFFWLTAHGVPARWLGRRDLARLQPRLAPSVHSAMLLPSFAVDPRKALTAITAACLRLGVELRYGTAVAGIASQRIDLAPSAQNAGGKPVISADEIILASGAWTPALAAAAHLDLPGEPVQGQMARLGQASPDAAPLWPSAPDGPAGPGPSFIHGHGHYLVRRGDGTVVVGATMVHNSFDRRDDPAAIAHLVDGARLLVPALDAAVVRETWTGLRPRLRGGLPVIARVSPGLLIATGHFRNGILLAPVTADILADLAEHRTPLAEALPFTRWPAEFPRENAAL